MKTHLETVDTDGAIQEAQAGLDGITRSSFFAKAAVGGGAVLGSGAILGMLPELAAAAKPSKKNDIAILNYALTLEYLEAAFYAEAVAKGALSGAVLETAKLIASHESTHVTALKSTIKALKGKAVATPQFNFKGTTGAQDSFLQTAFVLENTGVHAYLGQAGNLLSKTLLVTAAKIVTIEARHAAAIAGYIDDKPYDLSGAGKNYTPQGAFDTPWSKARVLKNVGKTGFIVTAPGSSGSAAG
jgi:Ferritin-like domain